MTATLLAESKPRSISDPRLASLFDLTDAPFSRRACWLSLLQQAETGENVLYLRTARGQVLHRTLLRIELFKDNVALAARLQVKAGSVRLQAVEESGHAEFVIAGESILRARVEGVGLRLTMESQPYSSSMRSAPNRWHLNYNAARIRLMVRALRGNLLGHAPFVRGKSDTEPAQLTLIPSAGESAEVEVTEFESSWVAPGHLDDFDDVVQTAQREFDEWFAAFGEFCPTDGDLARRAAFVLWSNTVPAVGNYAAPAVMMSQNALTGIWSWDHCFVALALAKSHPQQAWEQWWLPFELQSAEGMLPDVFSEAHRDFGMTKPPIHGWALLKMLPDLELTREQMEKALAALDRWTNWWLTHRDDDEDGIPQYNHGCESGWDNDSICSNAIPCEAPDLSVYIIQQYQAMAELSRRLGDASKAEQWENQADALWQRLCEHSFSEGRWLALQSGTHKASRDGDCLRLYWPLLLGTRMESEQRDAMLSDLICPGHFRTRYGYATEAISSPLYQSHGYWLGPIWAPSTYQVVEILRSLGHAKEAALTARAFCDLCASKGFRENFDAMSGDGLCDRGFAWTAAVCLSFLRDFRGETSP